MITVEAPTIEHIEAAANRIADTVSRTPLVPFASPTTERSIFLKLENLQPIGSFKLRGAANAMGALSIDELRHGVFTASAGNMAQGVAWSARKLGVACRVVVPDHAPSNKLRAIEKLGGVVTRIPFEDWWNILSTHRHDGFDGYFIHPVSNTLVMAGNGTIGLEIAEDQPNTDTVFIPYGGGGLTTGVATAMRAKLTNITVIAVEASTATPLTAAFAAGKPTRVTRQPSFVDGIGGQSVLEEMWPIVRDLIDDVVVVTPEEIAAAIRTLAKEARVIAEGAGAATVAAATKWKGDTDTVACVISGGNIEPTALSKILSGETP